MLYIVATPIGNLEDITLRALRVLGEVDIIAAEDTRRTVKLLNHYDIKTKLISFHEHSGSHKLEQILEELKEGKNIALVSDAGTPLISDPGAELVDKAAKLGIEITSLPGACAAITAMTLSGLDGEFVFIGFLSKKARDRRRQIERIAGCDMPCILYESPHMLERTLEELSEACGKDRSVIIAKELTKLHESVFRGTLREALDIYSGDIKGEYVVITGGIRQTKNIKDDEIRAVLKKMIDSGMTKKDAAGATSKKLGISKNRAYKLTIIS